MTLDEAEAKIRAAWQGLPRQDIPACIVDFLVKEGTIYQHNWRLFVTAEA